MDPIERYLFLSPPTTVLTKSIRNAEKIFNKHCRHIEKQRKALVKEIKKLKKSKTPSLKQKILLRVDVLIKKITELNQKLGKMEAHRSKAEKLLAKRVEFLVQKPEFPEAKRGRWEDFVKEVRDNSLVPFSPFEGLEKLEKVQMADHQRVDNHEIAVLDSLVQSYLFRNGVFDVDLTEGNRDYWFDTNNLIAKRHYLKCTSLCNEILKGENEGAIQWCERNSTALSRIDNEILNLLRLEELSKIVFNGGEITSEKTGKMFSSEVLKFVSTFFNDKIILRNAAIFSSILLYSKGTGKLDFSVKNLLKKRTELKERFEDAFYVVNGIPMGSNFEMIVTLGMSAIATRKCLEEKNPNDLCPVCVIMKKYREIRPKRVKFKTSAVFCRMSGEVLNNENPPMVTVHGSVFGLKSILARNERNKILCPLTMKYFALDDCVRAFLV